MAECNPWVKASQQHMAHLRQEDSVPPTVLVHQHQHQQTALIVVQALEHQRLALLQHQNQQLESQQDLLKPTQTLYLTEDN